MSRTIDLPIEGPESFAISVYREILSHGVLIVLRAALERFAPVGYQDMAGFHLGAEPWPGCSE
jgi:hypothetical protein